MTCLSVGVARKISWTSRRISLTNVSIYVDNSFQPGVEPTNLLQHLVTFVENESLHAAERQLLLANQGVQPTRSANDDVGERVFVREHLNILLNRGTTVEHGGLDVRKVLAESRVLVLDLERQLAGVAHDKDGALAGNRLQLVKSRQDEDCSLSKTGLGLAEHIDVEDRGRDADLLDCRDAKRRMLDLVRTHEL